MKRKSSRLPAGKRLSCERLEERAMLAVAPVAADWIVELPYGSPGATLRDSAVDPAGNLVVLGEFSGTVDFDPGAATYPLTSDLSSDLFVAKYDVHGGLIDAVDIGDFQIRPNGNQSLAVDGTGSVYITSGYEGQVQLMGGHTLPAPQGNDEAALFAKLDSTLQTVEWASHATLTSWSGYSRGSIAVNNIAADATGDGVYFSGTQAGQGQFGDVSVQQELDGFVSRIEGDTGAFAWVKTLKGKGGTVVAVDPTDASAVYAREATNCCLESTLMRLSAGGDVVWEKAFADNVFWGDIDAHSGAIYLAGSFSGEAVLGQSTLVAAGERDVLAARFDATTGDVDWATRAGGADDDTASRVTIDSDGNLFLAGSFEDIADFGSDTLAERTPNDEFLSQLDGPTGVFLQSWRFAGDSLGIAGRDGAVYAVGRFDAANADFPFSDVPTASSGFFNYLMRFDPTADATTPRINGFVATPDPAEQGSPVALSVVGMHDPGSLVERVAFYHDTDGDRQLNLSIDTLLGVDTGGLDGWGIDAPTSVLPLGDVQFLSQATYDGGELSLTASATTFLRLPASTYVSSEVGQTIRDLKTLTSTLNVPDSFALGDVDVTLTITHQFNLDLEVFLIHPDGTRVELFTRVGGAGAANENFIDTTLDDQADDPLGFGGAPFTGTFRPEGMLSDLNGKEASGIWGLEITDKYRGRRGTLEAWSLTLAPLTPSAPTLSINDAQVTEGDGGTVTAQFTVTRAGDASQTVTVDYTTADGSANAGSDYTAIPTTTLTFGPHVTTLPVNVTVSGDTQEEGDETFLVNLTNAIAGATIADGQGVGTILGDDAPVGSNSIYVWDIASTTKRRGRHTDFRILVDINSDSNADGNAQASDAAAAGALVTVELRNSNGQLVGTYTGTTNSAGVFQTTWIKGLADDTYTANVVELALEGFVWDPLAIDYEDDSDGDLNPDDVFPFVG